MTYSQLETPKDPVSLTEFDEGERIETYAEFFDALMSSPSRVTAIDKARITEKFFDLKSGLAGDILQKVSNYRRQLIIIGDFSNVENKSLRDFIFESNRTGQVMFVPTLEKGIELLRKN